MFASTVFTFIAVLCIAALFVFYLLLAVTQQLGWLRLEALLPPPEECDEEEEEEEEQQQVRHSRSVSCQACAPNRIPSQCFRLHAELD